MKSGVFWPPNLRRKAKHQLIKELKRKTKYNQQEWHQLFVLEKMSKLKKEGYKSLNTDRLRPDIIAFKDGKIYAFEIELKSPSLWNRKRYKEVDFFDEIIWINKTGMNPNAQ